MAVISVKLISFFRVKKNVRILELIREQTVGIWGSKCVHFNVPEIPSEIWDVVTLKCIHSLIFHCTFLQFTGNSYNVAIRSGS